MIYLFEFIHQVDFDKIPNHQHDKSLFSKNKNMYFAYIFYFAGSIKQVLALFTA